MSVLGQNAKFTSWSIHSPRNRSWSQEDLLYLLTRQSYITHGNEKLEVGNTKFKKKLTEIYSNSFNDIMSWKTCQSMFKLISKQVSLT